MMQLEQLERLAIKGEPLPKGNRAAGNDAILYAHRAVCTLSERQAHNGAGQTAQTADNGCIQALS